MKKLLTCFLLSLSISHALEKCSLLHIGIFFSFATLIEAAMLVATSSVGVFKPLVQPVWFVYGVPHATLPALWWAVSLAKLWHICSGVVRLDTI
jgi:hypothetical protein